MKKEDVIRFQGCVGFEFSYPVSLRGLQGEQVIHGSLDDLLQVFVEADFSVSEPWLSRRVSDSAWFRCVMKCSGSPCEWISSL